MQLTQIQFRVFEAAALAPEHERNVLILCEFDRPCRRGTRIDERPVHVATARTGTNGEYAVADGLFQRVEHTGVFEHVVCARGTCHGFRIRIAFGRNQREVVQPHDFHGACCRADIARMLGADEHDA